MIKYCVVAFAACAIAGAALAATLTPADIVARHNAAVAKSDVDAMMADYADDAIVLLEGKTVQGKTAIRTLFDRMFPKPVAGAPATGAAAMTVTRKWSEGDVGFYTWERDAIHGTDEFVVRNGKIEIQSVFIGAGPAAK
jgi:ketosteroid isomerase-like protein